MPKRVRFEGVVHNFPDDFTDDEISAALSGGSEYVTARPEEPKDVFHQDIGESAMQAITGAGKQVMEAIPAIGNAMMHPLDTINAATQARYAAWNKGDDPSKGLVERGAYKAAGLLPFIGPAAVAAGERLGSGQPEEMGRGAADTVGMVLGASPTARGAVRAAAPRVVGAADRLVEGGKNFIENHPSAGAVIGGGIGLYHSGPVGMVEGALGGGALGKAMRVVDKYLSKQPANPATTAGVGAPAKPPASPRLIRAPEFESQLQIDLRNQLERRGIGPSRPPSKGVSVEGEISARPRDVEPTAYEWERATKRAPVEELGEEVATRETAPAAAPAAAKPKGPSSQSIQNELGMQAKRQRVTLTEQQYKNAEKLVRQGRSVEDVVKRLGSAQSQFMLQMEESLKQAGK